MKAEFPKRRKPIHLPQVELYNRPVVFFVTVCTRERQAVLATPEIHGLLREAWTQAGNFLVGRYVVMPDHVHLFCAPSGSDASLGRWIRCWKSLVARNANGAGALWQREFWDTQVRNGRLYEEKWGYVRMNPERAGLVASADDWEYQGEVFRLGW